MAHDRLEPNRDLILRLQAEGRTLAEIAETLADRKGIATTPATLSRFLKALGKPQRLKELTPAEGRELDITAVLAELIAEMRGRSDEQRAALEGLAGQIAAMAADIRELEARVAEIAAKPGTLPPIAIQHLGLRAIAPVVIAVALIATAVWMLVATR